MHGVPVAVAPDLNFLHTSKLACTRGPVLGVQLVKFSQSSKVGCIHIGPLIGVLVVKFVQGSKVCPAFRVLHFENACALGNVNFGHLDVT